MADPLRTCVPADVGEVAQIVRRAEEEGVTVRAVGSGHSWSDVALTGGYLVRPEGMQSRLDLEPDLMRWDAARLENLVRVEAGMRIRKLNRVLQADGLALRNMGGYDGQTVAGVMSTSTHGSGKEFGPLNDAVRSIDVVAAGGKLYRIERHDGPTDAAAWSARHDGELVQDDALFRGALVGMGCLGVICSFILEVRRAYLLNETRTGTTWEDERDRIAEGLDAHDRYELLLTPYAREDGKHSCMVTTRDEYTGRQPPWWSSRSRRNLFAETVSALPVTGWAFKWVEKVAPAAVPFFLEFALKQLQDDAFTNASYRVMNIGAANALPARSMEIGVPVDGSSHIEAIERIFEIAVEFRTVGRVYHTAPIALRFVKGSDAYLSMMNGRELTMMIELILLDGSYGSDALFAAYEQALLPKGRPHWGQVNNLNREDVAGLYPELDAWLAVHARLNSSGVFNSPFSQRIGIAG